MASSFTATLTFMEISLIIWLKRCVSACAQVKPDCSNFDESQAWPLLLDNYVEHVKKQQVGNS